MNVLYQDGKYSETFKTWQAGISLIKYLSRLYFDIVAGDTLYFVWTVLACEPATRKRKIKSFQFVAFDLLKEGVKRNIGAVPLSKTAFLENMLRIKLLYHFARARKS